MARKESAQVIVVGAGPAGSRAATALATAGMEVLLVDKKERPGTPVRCGEGIGGKGLAATGLDIKSEWISARITKSVFYSPAGHQVGVENMETAYILERAVFDYDLAQMAGQAGAKLLLNTTILHVGRQDDQWRLLGQKHDENIELRTKLLIIAEGVESKLARQLGFCSSLPLYDLATCAQVLADNVDIDQDRCYFYTGARWAPGGYAWAFPKGRKKANIGLGILGKLGDVKKPVQYLEEFCDRHFPGATVLNRSLGGVPVGHSLKKLAMDGAMVVGDAARQVNCLNGGGLSYALSAGHFAGEVAVRALREGDLSEKRLREYSRLWQKGLGKQQKRSYYIKEALLLYNDEQLDKIAARISGKSGPNSPSLLELFSHVFLHKPSMLWKVLRLLS